MPTAIEEHNKAIVQRWIDEVFNSGNIAAVDELKVSSYLDWTPLPAPFQHAELPVSGIKAALPEWLEALPDFSFSSDRMLAESEFVVCLGHWSAHHKASYKGIAPTQKRVGGTRIDIFRVAGDRMVEHWGCGNELAFLDLVGALPTDGAPDRPASAEQIAREFIERTLGRRDLTAAAQLLDPQAIDHSRQALSMLALLGAFPDLAVEVTGVERRNGDFVTTAVVEGTHERPFLGLEASGKRVRAERRDRFRIQDGRICEAWRESDDSALLAQLDA